MEKTLPINTTISHYRLINQLGAGGMGEVLAEDTRLGRRVAIKFLPQESTADEQAKKRLVREARAAAKLDHPNICAIHEVDEEDGRSFIVMQYLEGETLAKLIQRKPVELCESLDIAVQIAGALAEAHSRGIVHRDIKPQNVMITARGQVKVLDFGLAKIVLQKSLTDTAAQTERLLTEPGMIIGTVPYMSPEQVQGETLDERSDIFSFGAVMYEMLSRHQPFAAENAATTISTILTKEPPPLARYSREVPGELERIVSKALRKDREQRYQTAKDLLIDLKSLRHHLEFEAEMERSEGSLSSDGAMNVARVGQISVATEKDKATRTAEIAAARTSSAEYVVNEIKRHKLAALIALLVVAATAVGLWFYFHARNSQFSIESIAVLPFVNASGNADVEYLSDGIVESLINSLSQLPKLSVKARSSVVRYKGNEVEPRQVAGELSVQALLNGRVVQRGDDLALYLSMVDARSGNQLWGEQYNRKLTDLVSLQSEIAHDVSQKLRARLSGADEQKLAKNYTQNAEAYQAYLKGRYYWNKGPAPGYERSRNYFEQAIDLDPSYALAYSSLADYYGYASANGHLPANENWPKAEAAANKALALDPTLAETYNPLAAVKLYYYRDWPAAERYFRRGIELDPNFTEIRVHYALCLGLFRRDEEALTEIRRAIQLEPLSLRFNLFWARLLFFIRQDDNAIDQYRKTLELEQNFAPAHEWLGDAYEQKGMHREAIAEWGRALTLSGQQQQASILERAYAASSFETAVRALAQKKLELLNEKTGRGEYVPASEYVMAYLRLGDKEKLFGWLAKAVEERNAFPLSLKFNPLFDSLRSDPRFADLVQRVGFLQ